MPPFQNTPLVELLCKHCNQPFLTKRPQLAKACSTCKAKCRPRRKYHYDPERWAKVSPERKAKRAEKDAQRNRDIKKWIAAFKLERGCTDCGYRQHHSALDFDHVRGEKKLNVCFSKSISQATTEAEKCEVVCSNCHRIRTYNRIHTKKSSEETLVDSADYPFKRLGKLQ